MLELLHFYTSGFWTWAGITIGISVFGTSVAATISCVRRG